MSRAREKEREGAATSSLFRHAAIYAHTPTHVRCDGRERVLIDIEGFNYNIDAARDEIYD